MTARAEDEPGGVAYIALECLNDIGMHTRECRGCIGFKRCDTSWSMESDALDGHPQCFPHPKIHTSVRP